MAAELHVKLSLHINFKRFNCHILKRHWAYLKGVTGNAYKNHGPCMLPFLHLDFKSKVKAAHPTNLHPTGRKKSSDTGQREELRPRPGGSVLEQTSPKDLWGEGLVSSSSFHGSSSFSWVWSARTGSPASREHAAGPGSALHRVVLGFHTVQFPKGRRN